jgi:hypothetical protein
MEPMAAILTGQAAVKGANAQDARELLSESQYEVITEQNLNRTSSIRDPMKGSHAAALAG